MPTTDMTRLMTDLRVRLPGALDNVIQQEMFATVDEFMKHTNAWQEGIPVAQQANEDTYELVPTGPSLINRLMGLLNSSKLPVAATMSEPGTIVLRTMPSQTDTLTATVALTVVDPVDNEKYPQFPAWILGKYRDAFFDGILGRMMSQPAKPYANQQLAVYHTRRWRGAMATAKVEVQRNNLFRAQAWNYPQGFRVTHRR